MTSIAEAMFVASDTFPFNFPDRTIALTYDDGPGRDTLELAEFLTANGIRATFFVVGKHVEQSPDAVQKVHGLGHLIGNHTMMHPYLPEIRDSAVLVGEVQQTHRLIEKAIGNATKFFRAPYGGWLPWMASALNRVHDLEDYKGPVKWSMERGDYGIGSTIDPNSYDQGDLRSGAIGTIYTLALCQDNYLALIRTVQRGIVLLHDSSADKDPVGATLRANNQTLALTKWLVPRLKADGFNFVALDDPRL